MVGGKRSAPISAKFDWERFKMAALHFILSIFVSALRTKNIHIYTFDEGHQFEKHTGH